MASGQRPGGLTALAVLNFVFGGFGVLVVIGLAALAGLIQGAGAEARKDPNYEVVQSVILIGLVVWTVNVFLLIASGVGYLQQKRVLGKILGNLFGLLALVGTAVSVIGSGQFGIGDIVFLIYPVLTLVLLNTTFKDDFPY